MKFFDLHSHLRVIAGIPLDSFHLAGDMMMFSFGKYELHSQCLTRIISERSILITTLDCMNSDDAAESGGGMRRFAEEHRNEITGGTVSAITLSPVNDLTITLDNGIRIELFVSNGCGGEDLEQWVFFRHHDHSYPFVTVGSRSVDVTAKW